MRQIKKIEEKKIIDNKLHPLFITIFSDNLEQYVFPHLKLQWRNSQEKAHCKSFIFLIDQSTIFLIENYSTYANLFIMVPEISTNYIPNKKSILKSLKKLNICDQQIWFNEWHFLPKHAVNLKSLITEWINKDYSLQDIKEKTLHLTQLEENEVKNLLTSHQMLAGSHRLKEIYPT